MYKICLIDDEKDFYLSLDGFLESFFKSDNSEYELIFLNPTDIELEELLSLTLEGDFDLVLIDLKLIESYDGKQIINKLNYRNPYLPKVILSSDPSEFLETTIEFRAINKEDINTKNIDGKGTQFYETIKTSIDEYRNRLEELQKEFDELQEKVSGKHTPKQLERFLEIDEEITRTYGLDSRINKSILDKTELSELQEIITLAKQINNELQEE